MPDKIRRNRTMYPVKWRDLMSEAYRDLMSSVFREQAVRTLQRAARRVLQKKNHTVSVPVTPKITRSDSIHRVVQEPRDDTYQKHVEKINAGKYIELDFTDPQFIRNLYKSLRLNFINKDQLFKAMQIYQAKEWLHHYDYPAPQLHAFDSLDHKHFSFLFHNEQLYPRTAIENFFSRLQPEDRQCVTINLPRLHEVGFFELSPEALKTASPLFNALYNLYTPRHDPALLQQVYAASTIDIESMVLFLIAVGSATHMPLFTISPDYDDNNPNTPLVCVTLFTPEAQRQLQLAMGFGDEITRGELVACPVTTRQIRAYDERPRVAPVSKTANALKRKLTDADLTKMRNAPAAEIMHHLYGSQYTKFSKQARPVEITHPDVMRNGTVHGREACDFLLTGHDLYHVQENGAFFKPLIRHVRSLLCRRGSCHEKDFLMTVPIWLLSDLNIEKNYFTPYNDHKRMSFFLLAVFDIALREKDTKTAHVGPINKDLYFLFFIDMIKNHEQWNDYFKLYADKLEINENFRQFMSTFLYRDGLINETTVDTSYLFGNEHLHGCLFEIAEMFNTTFKDESLISMIQSHASKSNEYLILRCKLKDHPRAQKVCDAIEEVGIEKFLYWTANKGLHFKSEYHVCLNKVNLNGDGDIESLTSTSLLKALTLCLETYIEKEVFNDTLKVEHQAGMNVIRRNPLKTLLAAGIVAVATFALPLIVITLFEAVTLTPALSGIFTFLPFLAALGPVGALFAFAGMIAAASLVIFGITVGITAAASHRRIRIQEDKLVSPQISNSLSQLSSSTELDKLDIDEPEETFDEVDSSQITNTRSQLSSSTELDKLDIDEPEETFTRWTLLR